MNNYIKTKLASGKPVIGIWSIIPSPIIAEIFGIAGMDFQILDLEHGVYDNQSLDASIRASEAAGCSPLVRVAGVDPFTIQTCLDMGAHGIIVPQIHNHEAATKAISCMKYAPNGSRGFNPFTRAGNYNGSSNFANTKLSDQFGLSSIIIENVQAYKELDTILTIPDLDMLYLGIYDMSVSLGCKGEMNAPILMDFVETSIKKIRNANKWVGLMVKNQDEMKYYLALGANLFVYTVDTFVIHNAVASSVKQFKKAQNQEEQT